MAKFKFLRGELEIFGEDIIIVRNSDHFYSQPIDKDDSQRKEIDFGEYHSLKHKE